MFAEYQHRCREETEDEKRADPWLEGARGDDKRETPSKGESMRKPFMERGLIRPMVVESTIGSWKVVVRFKKQSHQNEKVRCCTDGLSGDDRLERRSGYN